MIGMLPIPVALEQQKNVRVGSVPLPHHPDSPFIHQCRLELFGRQFWVCCDAQYQCDCVVYDQFHCSALWHLSHQLLRQHQR